MGDEFYMVGCPHPMIDGSQRALGMTKEANDPEVAVLLIDFILGYNSSIDPVGELVEAIQEENLKWWRLSAALRRHTRSNAPD